MSSVETTKRGTEPDAARERGFVRPERAWDQAGRECEEPFESLVGHDRRRERDHESRGARDFGLASEELVVDAVATRHATQPVPPGGGQNVADTNQVGSADGAHPVISNGGNDWHERRYHECRGGDQRKVAARCSRSKAAAVATHKTMGMITGVRKPDETPNTNSTISRIASQRCPERRRMTWATSSASARNRRSST